MSKIHGLKLKKKKNRCLHFWSDSSTHKFKATKFKLCNGNSHKLPNSHIIANNFNKCFKFQITKKITKTCFLHKELTSSEIKTMKEEIAKMGVLIKLKAY